MTIMRVIGFAVSPGPATFAPLLFAGRLEEAVRMASDLGLGCLELNVRDPSTVSAPQVQALLGPAGLVVERDRHRPGLLRRWPLPRGRQ